MNPLDNYPGARKALYLLQWVVNLALGITALVLTTQSQSPEWFVLTGAVFNFVWTYTGITAQTNTVDKPVKKNFGVGYRDEDGAADMVLVAVVLIAVLVLLIFLAVFGVIHTGVSVR